MQYQIGRSAGVPSCRTSVAVGKGFFINRQVVVHHVVHARNVESACSQVGRHQYGAASVTELVKGPLTVGLLHAAVKHFARKLPRTQVLHHALHTLTVIHKHQRRGITQATQQVVQCLQLVLFRRKYLLQAQTCSGLFRRQEVELHQPLPVHTGKLRNLFGIGCRKQYALPQRRQLTDDFGHFVLKAELQTLVELVDDQRCHPTGIEILFLQMVVHAPRRADDDRRVQSLHRTVLVHSRTPAVTAHRLERRIHGLEHAFYLQRQFARGYQHHCLHALHIGFQRAYQRQKESQRLTRPRGRKQYKVTAGSIRLTGCFLHRVQLFDIQVMKNVLKFHIAK